MSLHIKIVIIQAIQPIVRTSKIILLIQLALLTKVLSHLGEIIIIVIVIKSFRHNTCKMIYFLIKYIYIQVNFVKNNCLILTKNKEKTFVENYVNFMY